MPWWQREPVVDPAAAVDELRRLLARQRDKVDDERLFELYDGLTSWRTRGGFWSPEFESVWTKAQAACQV